MRPEIFRFVCQSLPEDFRPKLGCLNGAGAQKCSLLQMLVYYRPDLAPEGRGAHRDHCSSHGVLMEGERESFKPPASSAFLVFFSPTYLETLLS